MISIVRKRNDITAVGRPARAEEAVRARQLRNLPVLGVEQIDKCLLACQVIVPESQGIPIG
jgi:hypothetical protein